MLTPWDTLASTWQRVFSLGVDAYLRLSSAPIGAVIVGADGEWLAEGMNACADHRLAHAEMNALAALPVDANTRECSLYVTVEPCPMCTGAIRMMQLSSVHFAAADPAAGSSHCLSVGPFMCDIPCRVYRPVLPDLEFAVTALVLEHRERTGRARWRSEWLAYLPSAARLGVRLAKEGVFARWHQEHPSAGALFNELIAEKLECRDVAYGARSPERT